MADSSVAAPLSFEDVKAILAICSPRGLLVGGQALALWADQLAVDVPKPLVPVVTVDADFIGDSELAKELGERLGWKTWLPSIDDATPQTGKVTRRQRSGAIKQVDFLSGVMGLTTKDLVRRAVTLDIPSIGQVRLMHPVDLLDSRIQNLHLLPEKRSPAGIAQASLAVDVVRAYLRDAIGRQGERVGLRLLERVAGIASDIAGVRVFLLCAIDPLQAVPLDAFRTTPKLHRQRWPQIVAQVVRLRDASRRSLRGSKGR